MTHLYVLITHKGVSAEVVGPYLDATQRDKFIKCHKTSEHGEIMKFIYSYLKVVDGVPEIAKVDMDYIDTLSNCNDDNLENKCGHCKGN